MINWSMCPERCSSRWLAAARSVERPDERPAGGPCRPCARGRPLPGLPRPGATLPAPRHLVRGCGCDRQARLRGRGPCRVRHLRAQAVGLAGGAADRPSPQGGRQDDGGGAAARRRRRRPSGLCGAGHRRVASRQGFRRRARCAGRARLRPGLSELPGPCQASRRQGCTWSSRARRTGAGGRSQAAPRRPRQARRARLRAGRGLDREHRHPRKRCLRPHRDHRPQPLLRHLRGVVPEARHVRQSSRRSAGRDSPGGAACGPGAAGTPGSRHGPARSRLEPEGRGTGRKRAMAGVYFFRDDVTPEEKGPS